MITILIAAQTGDPTFKDTFSAYLEKRLDGAAGFFRAFESDSYAICNVQDVVEPVNGKTIVVFVEPVELPLHLIDPDQTIAVVDSVKEALLDLVSGTGLPAVACGMRSRDTITLSSMDDDSAVVDLRRAVRAFEGNVLEPQEIPVRFDHTPHKFALMAAAAVLLLSGNLQAMGGKM